MRLNVPRTARAGLVVGALGILILSPDALLLRLFTGDDYALVAGRSFFLAIYALIFTFCFVQLRSGFDLKKTLCYGTLYAIGLVSFPMSIKNTYVANTVVILAIAPLLSAAGAWIFLGERVERRTWFACAVAVIGLGVIFSSQLSIGGLDGLVGDLLALVTACSLAACAIYIRRHPQTNLFSGLVFAGILCGVLYAPFADWQLSERDMGILVLNGGVLAVAFLGIMVASRRLSPPEINLLFLIETATAPLWVWLVLHEQPPLATVFAGILIVAVLVWHSRNVWVRSSN